MPSKPTYEQLERTIQKLKKEIIEGKKIVHSLQKREQKYRFLTEGVSDIIWTLDLNLKATYVSPSVTKVLGFTPEEIMCREASELMTAESCERAFNTLAQKLETVKLGVADPDRPLTIEIEYHHKNGYTVWMENIVQWIQDHDGNLLGIHGVSRDITDRKRAQNELQIHHDMLSAVFESSPHIMFLINEKERAVRINRAGRNLYSRSEEQVLNQPCGNILFCQNAIQEKGCGYNPPCAECPVRTRFLHTMQTGESTFNQEGQMTLLVKEKPEIRHFLISTTQLKTEKGPQVLVTLSDITDHKRAEEALIERDIQFRKLSSNVPGMIYLFKKCLDGTYCVPFTSEGIKDIFGCLPHDVRKDFSPISRVILPEDLDKVIGSIEFSAEQMTTWECEYRVQLPGKPIRWMSGLSTPEKLADGSIVWYGFNTDITERKKAEKELRDSEEKYRNIFESQRDAAFVADRKTGMLIDANRQALILLGRSIEEIKQMHFTELHPPEQADILINESKNLINQEDLKEIEADIVTKDGKKIPVSIITTGLTIDGKRRILGLFRDKTNQKETEKALRESEYKYRTLFNSIPSAVAITTAQDGRYIDVNNFFLQLMGYSRDEVVERTARDLNVFVNFAERDKIVKECSERGEINEFGVKYRKKDGTIFNARLTAKQYLYKGEKCLIGASRDVTLLEKALEEERKLRTQLQQAQKMESIGNLAGGIAHDFNNILASIIGFTELALDDVSKGTLLEENLREIYMAGNRAKELVQQILAFARQSDEELKPIQVSTIAKEVVKLIRSTIPTTIEVKENITSKSLIVGSPSQVHQIFMNLCTNAASAMEGRGGILAIDLTDAYLNGQAQKSLSMLNPGNYLKIIVSDTGSGISPDIIDSIFEPYFTTKVVGEGTGLGLALVHGIVESYGGKIIVDSKLDKGTIFTIYLPTTKKREDIQIYEQEPLPSGTERILFVDDELPIARIASQILERLGYNVTIRTSSVEALELFRSKPKKFDLVITDMTMPNMTGDELAIELIACRADIPVILCTGYSKKISNETATKIGIKAFAYKPVVKADLAKTVRKVLDEAKGQTWV